MFYFLLALIVPSFVIAHPYDLSYEEAVSSEITSQTAYARPHAIDSATWHALSQYFLPPNHPIKEALDRIFSSRVTLNGEALAQAGFYNPQPREFSRIIVSGHPDLQNYLIKVYTDDQPNIEWIDFKNRIEGANYIQEAINRHGYSRYFQVPKKWLYPLPVHPSPPPESFQKHFVLVVEDMNISPKKTNFKQWQGATLTPKLLDAVYVIIQDVGLDDSIYPFNLPFTKKGKLAFIDTARHHLWPIPFDKLTKYLSPKMQQYWRKLIANHGPKHK